MKFFVDTADTDAIRELNALGMVDGVTTNPSLIMKSGRDIKEVTKEICDMIPGPVSAETVATDADGMIAEGLELKKIADNIAVKVPLTWAGLKACKTLTDQGSLQGGADMLPKPTGGRVPLLITGGSQQSPDWVAQNGDGWMTYPRDAASQGRVVADYRRRIAEAGGPNKPVMQSLYVDVLPDRDAEPRPIHLGFSSGTAFLQRYLSEIQALGINHVALNLRFNAADVEDTMKRIADELIPAFSQ